MVVNGALLTDEQHELRLLPAAGSVAAGRRWVQNEAEVAGVGGDVLDVLEVLTSELVSNAVVHGPQDGVVRVRAHVLDDVIRVSVGDDSQVRPVPRAADPGDLHGRGLILVEALATAWGVDVHPADGKDVWFELAIA